MCMLQNKSLNIIFIVSYYQGGWLFIVLGCRWSLIFFLYKMFFFCNKIGVERPRAIILWVSFIFIDNRYISYFNLPDSYFPWARDDVSIPSKLVWSRRSKFAGDNSVMLPAQKTFGSKHWCFSSLQSITKCNYFN